MEEQSGSGKLVIGLVLVLLLLVITPIILFLGAGDEAETDPNAPCVIEGIIIGDTEQQEKPKTSIPEQYRQGVEDAAKTAGLPVGIIAAQLQQESNWNPKAQSPVGG